jgi:predicted small metal-binding protein
MKKHIACGDVVEGCPFTTEAESEAELVDKVRTDAAQEHGVKEVTPELAARVKAAIQNR